MSEKFSLRLRQLRKKNGLTQARLAQRLDKAESTIRMWELGKNHPDYDSLLRLAQLLGVRVDYLLGVDEPTGPKGPPRPAFQELMSLAAAMGDEDLARLVAVARAFGAPLPKADPPSAPL